MIEAASLFLVGVMVGVCAVLGTLGVARGYDWSRSTQWCAPPKCSTCEKVRAFGLERTRAVIRKTFDAMSIKQCLYRCNKPFAELEQFNLGSLNRPTELGRAKVLSIAIVGPGGCGKTILKEQIIKANSSRRFETPCNAEELEAARKRVNPFIYECINLESPNYSEGIRNPFDVIFFDAASLGLGVADASLISNWLVVVKRNIGSSDMWVPPEERYNFFQLS